MSADGSECNDPKYASPPASPVAVAGIVVACRDKADVSSNQQNPKGCHTISHLLLARRMARYSDHGKIGIVDFTVVLAFLLHAIKGLGMITLGNGGTVRITLLGTSDTDIVKQVDKCMYTAPSVATKIITNKLPRRL